MSDLKEYEKKFENLIDENKIGKEEDILTEENCKFSQKQNSQEKSKEKPVIPFTQKKNNNYCCKSEEKSEYKNEIKMLEKTIFRKNKKTGYPIKSTITTGKSAYYEENGKAEKFDLYIDKALGLNIYENIINTRTYNPEEDFESDNLIVLNGMKQVDEDLLEAIEIVKKNKFKNVCNYQRYHRKKHI